MWWEDIQENIQQGEHYNGTTIYFFHSFVSISRFLENAFGFGFNELIDFLFFVRVFLRHLRLIPVSFLPCRSDLEPEKFFPALRFEPGTSRQYSENSEILKTLQQ